MVVHIIGAEGFLNFGVCIAIDPWRLASLYSSWIMDGCWGLFSGDLYPYRWTISSTYTSVTATSAKKRANGRCSNAVCFYMQSTSKPTPSSAVSSAAQWLTSSMKVEET